jgi:aminoglycoside phosphotransferase family enzyme
VIAQRPAHCTAGPPRVNAEPSLDAKVAFLRKAANYPDTSCQVEAVETHMSWVFLLDKHVYKLKKPVCYELLDFRTLDARLYYCQEELRLNLRLAPEVYLGLVPLTVDRSGQLALSGHGAVVDWLVRMHRLPAEHMLDHAILHHHLDDADLLRLAKRLAGFYLGLPPEPVACESYRDKFRRQIAANQQELRNEEFELAERRVNGITGAQLAALDHIGSLLDQRVQAGRIVEAHGDLRPEHVYLGKSIAIIDCLEFSRELRVVDSADELGFLALECERLGAPPAGVTILKHYSLLAADSPPVGLLHFYQSCRAATRALIAARHLLDEKFRHSPHWQDRAGEYLDLAERHISQASTWAARD